MLQTVRPAERMRAASSSMLVGGASWAPGAEATTERASSSSPGPQVTMGVRPEAIKARAAAAKASGGMRRHPSLPPGLTTARGEPEPASSHERNESLTLGARKDIASRGAPDTRGESRCTR